jgi:hypothetical protein
MRDAHVHPSFVSPNIVHAVGHRLDGLSLVIFFRKVMGLDFDRLSSAAPRAARILVFSDDFLLLRINREGRLTRSLLTLDAPSDVFKLGISIRMLFSFNRLAVRLQAVTCPLQQSSDGRMTYRVAEFLQSLGKLPGTLARPFQRRLRITASGRFQQPFQSVQQAGFSPVDCCATGPDPSLPARRRGVSLTQFANPVSDRAIRSARRLGHGGNSTPSQRERFHRRPTTTRAFIQILREVFVLRLNPFNDRCIRHALRIVNVAVSGQYQIR